jgi:hypothetical protein
MIHCRTLSGPRSQPILVGYRSTTTAAAAFGKPQCLEQLLQAFFDIADRDDIHQAAVRLLLVQQWICDEVARAAADPIFADPVPT